MVSRSAKISWIFYYREVFAFAGGGASDTTTHVEQENFLRSIIHATPMALIKPGSTWMSNSNLSLDSIYSSGLGGSTNHHIPSIDSHSHFSQITPEVGRKGNRFAKAMNTLRYAG